MSAMSWLLALMLWNPYLAAFSALPADYRAAHGAPLIENGEATRDAEYKALRTEFTSRYSWAVPTHEAVATIAQRCTRVVDFGAGTGYWDALLAQSGVTVRAVDNWSWGKPEQLWFPVETGSFPWLDQFDSSWCLLMVWPPKGPMPVTALTHWKGSTLIYVGEFMRGTGDPLFHWVLLTAFDAIESVELPHWWNRNDWLYVFERK
jgi:hypothetical protein